MRNAEDNSLIRHAYDEQEKLNLTWFSNLKYIEEASEKVSLREPSGKSGRIRHDLKLQFIDVWNQSRKSNRKLGFYNSVKDHFGVETYLGMQIGSWDSKRLSQLRMSAHPFNIETGNYGIKQRDRLNRICKVCSTKNWDTIVAFDNLPFFDPVNEDELHVLRECTLYDDLRQSLSYDGKNALYGDLKAFMSVRAFETGRFLSKVWMRRFPKKD